MCREHNFGYDRGFDCSLAPPTSGNFDAPAHACPICIAYAWASSGNSHRSVIDPVGALRHVPTHSIGSVLFLSAADVRNHLSVAHGVNTADLADVISHHKIRGEDGMVARYFRSVNDGSDHIQKYWRWNSNNKIYCRMLACLPCGLHTVPLIPADCMSSQTKSFMRRVMEDQDSEPEFAPANSESFEDNVDQDSSGLQFNSNSDENDALRAFLKTTRSNRPGARKRTAPPKKQRKSAAPPKQRKSKRRVIESDSESEYKPDSGSSSEIKFRRRPVKKARISSAASSSSVSHHTRSSARATETVSRANLARNKTAVEFVPDLDSSVSNADDSDDSQQEEGGYSSGYESADLENDTFIVDKIIGHEVVNGKTMFHVKWQGYGDSENTWEPRESFLTEHEIEKYYASLNQNDSVLVVPETPGMKNDTLSLQIGPSSSSRPVVPPSQQADPLFSLPVVPPSQQVDASPSPRPVDPPPSPCSIVPLSQQAGPSSVPRPIVSFSGPIIHDHSDHDSGVETLIDAYNVVESSADHETLLDLPDSKGKLQVTVYLDGKSNPNPVVDRIRRKYGDRIGSIVVISH